MSSPMPSPTPPSPPLESLICPEGVRARVSLGSKKRVMEYVAQTACSACAGLDSRRVFEALLARERLGSTGLGHGVAIPHCRYQGCDQPLAVVLTLDEPVPFDAPDGDPVDILMALLVPEDADGGHLQLLATIAAALEQRRFRDRLRAAVDDGDLYDTSLAMAEVAQHGPS
jgi:PTS system nitrogen regulatory IIA component